MTKNFERLKRFQRYQTKDAQMISRKKMIERLRKKPNISVLVVGAGINGIGVFRELGLQGIDTLIIDKGDFCTGASSAPSRMIHGGLRYLENGEFRLVRESLKERNLLLENAPHYVNPLPTTIPIFNWYAGLGNALIKFFRLGEKPGKRGALLVKVGLSLYDFFIRKHQVMPKHQFRSRKKSLNLWPRLNTNIACTATYYDAWISYPERLGLEMILDTEASSDLNLNALNYMALHGTESGQVQLKDGLTGEVIPIRPKVVINATGAWIDFANQALQQKTKFIGGTKGSHLIIDNQELLNATNGHMVYYENPEGRVCILFPFMGKVLLGSTDIKIDDPDQVRCDEDEVKYILESVSYIFPSIKIKQSEIVYRFCGVRPLPTSDSSTTGKISRDHSCHVIPPTENAPYPIYSMVGGKWTTFRGFSEEVADQVLTYLKRPRITKTENLPIGGGKGYPRTKTQKEQWLTRVSETTKIPQKRLEVLLLRYGSKAESVANFIAQETDYTLMHHQEYSYREILYIFSNERVFHLDDLILRRLTIAIQGNLTSDLFYEIVTIAKSFFRWTGNQTQREIQRSLRILKRNHGLQLPDLSLQFLEKEPNVSVS